MTKPTKIDLCSSCGRGPRPVDPVTGACAPCLRCNRSLSEFFRLVREDPAFKEHARRDLAPSKRETFDAMFGTDERPPAYTGEVDPSEPLLIEDYDA